MRTPPVGGAARSVGNPAADLTLDVLLAAARGGKPVLLGSTWRLRVARWPTDRSDECLCIEAMRGGSWESVAILKPDGIWGA